MAKAPAKKVVKKPTVKKTVKKKVVAKKVVAKKSPKKIATKKMVVKKTPKKIVTKKAVKKVPTKKVVTKPAKKKLSKQAIKKLTTIDYFKLPFEVYYSQYIPVTLMDLKSNIDLKRFEDIKIVHKQQGGSWGASFYCQNNKGPELYCCIGNHHDEVAPEWLQFLDEENVKINYGCIYAVTVDGGEIKFHEPTEEQQDEASEEYLDHYEMDSCSSFFVYELGESSPDYIILDADNSRVKVSLDGFVLDDKENPTKERFFNPDDLDEDEFEDYSRQEMWEAKFNWIKSVLEKDFPKQKKLKLSWDTK